MKAITNTISITTEIGTVIKMTTTATRGFETVKEMTFCDGYNVEIEKGKEINEDMTILTINGKDYKGYFTTIMPAHILKGCFGCFLAGSQPIGLSEIRYNELINLVNLTKKEAETDETWIALQVKNAQSLKEEDEYYKNRNAIENAMTLNNKTY